MFNDDGFEWSISDGRCRTCNCERRRCEVCGMSEGDCPECGDCSYGCRCPVPVAVEDEVDTVRVEIEAVPAKVWERMTAIMLGGAR